MTLPSEDRKTGRRSSRARALHGEPCVLPVVPALRINIEDEGTLLYQFERLADGQRPYVDFHLGYTPGVYYIHSWLQSV
jgi:hypothetical protein